MNSRSTFTKILSISARVVPILFGCVFLVSGTAKIFSFNPFLETIRRFGGVASASDVPIAVLIITIELVIGGCIILNRLRTAATLSAIILLLVFITVIIVRLDSLNGVACQCFGPLVQNKLGAGVIIQDIVLLSYGLFSLNLSDLSSKKL